jgi:hypothetical protein
MELVNWVMDAVDNPIPFWATSYGDLGCPRATLPILDFRIPALQWPWPLTPKVQLNLSCSQAKSHMADWVTAWLSDYPTHIVMSSPLALAVGEKFQIWKHFQNCKLWGHSLQKWQHCKIWNVFKIVYKNENYCTATCLQTCKVSNGIKIVRNN